MAKPIKLTPVLKGVDALAFLSKLDDNSSKKVSKEILESIRENANKLSSILKIR